MRAVLQVPGAKKKKAGRHVLTPSASAYLETVLATGHLQALERLFQSEGKDYFLFPGGIGRVAPRQVVNRGDKALDRTVALNLFKELQQTAGVAQVAKRGFHGFRRRAVDVLVSLGATPSEIMAAGSWGTNQIPLDVYHAGIADEDGVRAADLLESRRPRQLPVDRLQGARPPVDVQVDYPATYPDLAHLLKTKNLTDAEIDEVLELSRWAWVELNYRPHAYQACALTT